MTDQTRSPGAGPDTGTRRASAHPLAAGPSTAALAAVPAAPDQQLSALVYALSHDVGAPVRHVRAFAALLGQSLSDLDAEQRQWLGFLDAGAELLQAMFDRLLPLSRVMAPVEQQTMAIVRLAEALEVEGAVPEGQVRVNVQRLGRALAELRTNADRYGSAAQTSLTSTVEGTHLCLLLRDGGRGIPQARWLDALKPFNRLGQACVPDAVGLGLTIATAAVEQEGGQLAWHPDGVAVVVPLAVV